MQQYKYYNKAKIYRVYMYRVKMLILEKNLRKSNAKFIIDCVPKNEAFKHWQFQSTLYAILDDTKLKPSGRVHVYIHKRYSESFNTNK